MLTAGLVALLLSLGAVALFRRVALQTGMLDAPGARSSHVDPTPTGGGFGMVIAWCATVLLAGFGFGLPGWEPQSVSGPLVMLLAWSLGLAGVGFRDDRRSLSPWLRLMVQCLAAGSLLLALALPGGWWSMLLLVALVWTMNAVNFMDGSNGLAGAQGLFSAALLAWAFHHGGATDLAFGAACLAGACAGFLPWNAPRARVFMGDAGSIPLGFLLGGLALAGVLAGALSWPLAILVLSPFHVDAGLTLLSRVRAGERWYTPHRRHVYQRLIAQGWSHGRVLLLYSAVNLTIVAPGVLLGTIQPQWAWWIASLILGLLSVSWYVVSLKLGKGT